MKKIAIAVLLYMAYGQAQSQKDMPQPTKENYTFIDLQGDTISYKDKASFILRKLKNGSVVVRLKTDQKSIDAYRKSGEEKIAQRIEDQRRIQNQKMYDAFVNYFTFCKVYFIYAEDTRKCLAGKHVFLNRHLAYDHSIVMRDTNFVFCEYGSAESYSRYTDISGFGVDEPGIAGNNYDIEESHTIMDTTTRQTSTDPASTSCLFFLDKKGNQLFRPFPAPEAVNINNYEGAVTRLNEEVDRAYYNLVLKKGAD